MLITGYRNLTGRHCGSTAMRNLVFHYCGLALTEEEVFGLGSGLDFLLIRNDANIIDLTLNLPRKVIIGLISVALSIAAAAVLVVVGLVVTRGGAVGGDHRRSRASGSDHHQRKGRVVGGPPSTCR